MGMYQGFFWQCKISEAIPIKLFVSHHPPSRESGSATSLPGSLIFLSPGSGKIRDPGNEVGGSVGWAKKRRRNNWLSEPGC